MATLAARITVHTHDMAIKERRIWYFTCTGPCGKKRRSSHRKSKAKESLCAVCLRSSGTVQKTTLFDSLGSEEVCGVRRESQSDIRSKEKISI